jgi:hypothetical protein
VALWRGYRDRAILLEAALAGRSGERAQALRLEQDVLRRLEMEADGGSNTDHFWLLQRFRLQTGDDLFALGRAADARKEWDAVVQSMSGPMENYEPKLLVVLEAADVRLTRPAAAEMITRRLREMSRASGGG